MEFFHHLGKAVMASIGVSHCLEPFALTSAQLHDLALQPLLLLIPNTDLCAAGSTSYLVTCTHPAGHSRLGGIPSRIAKDARDQLVVRMFERRRRQYLAQLQAQFFLIQIAKQKLRNRSLVYQPVGICNR
jgi:hypothetical protein